MIEFLDVTIFKGHRFFHHGIFDTKVYLKIIDTHELLNTASFHPKHVFKGIIVSQLTRYLRICNNLEDFQKAVQILFKVLREKCNYSGRYLRNIRTEFFKIHSILGNPEDPNGLSTSCGDKVCECCLWMKPSSYIEGPIDISNNTSGYYSIYGLMNCKSSNVIYVLECEDCNIKYVGKTRSQLKVRLRQHLSDIKTFKNTSVADHFNYDCQSKNNIANLIIYAVQQIPTLENSNQIEKKLLKAENQWIEMLNTLEPNGLNKNMNKDKEKINIPIQYSVTGRTVFQEVKKCYDSLKMLYPNHFRSDIRCSYSRNKNISQYLTHTKLR